MLGTSIIGTAVVIVVTATTAIGVTSIVDLLLLLSRYGVCSELL